MKELNYSRLHRLVERGVRFIVDVALLLHLLGAAAWWWLSPKGFSFGTSPFWTNSVLPLATMAVAIAGLIAMHRDRRDLAAYTVLCFAATWGAVAVAARLTFPLSFFGIWLLLVLVSLCGFRIFSIIARNQWQSRTAQMCSVAIGALVGIGIVRGQIPELPSTIPWQSSLQPTQHKRESSTDSTSVSPQSTFRFDADQQVLSFRAGDLHIMCKPLLEFERVSLDHCWSLLARRAWTPSRRLVRESQADELRTYDYDDGSSLEFSVAAGGRTCELVSLTPVPIATYSHLNSFCQLEISGHESLAVSFSPAPDSIIEVLPADYPFGRPARFAYLSEAGEFRVCEATSGEKGPFRELAAAPLERGKPLTIVLHDNGRPRISLSLDDWTSQLSTAISPSAGWGVPVNEIQFQRLGDAPNASVGIWISLAATAVGRGFETVGHAQGTYRNRMTLQLHPQEP